jgi:site-specific DNA-methyltransferase (adenine-specific)
VDLRLRQGVHRVSRHQLGRFDLDVEAVEAVTALYYQDESVTLWHGDYRDALTRYRRDDFDLVIADPPYAVTSLAWDRWQTEWPEIVAKYARSMWCFGSLRMFMDRAAEFGDWKLSQDIVWEKHNGSSLAADRFRTVHELAAFFYQGAWSDIYTNVPTTSDATPRSVRRKALPLQHQGARGPSVYESQDGGPRLMRSVIYAQSMHGQAIHPTQKPGGLLEPMIEYGCKPGGRVLDPFAGSCAVGVAARSLGRRTVCVEAREEQCEAAAKWLSNDTLTFGSERVS